VKIAIVTVQAPFVRGGAEYLADSLHGRLRGRGHEIDVVRIPFKWYPPQAIADHMLACRLLRVDAGDPDLVIGLKFPAYLVPFGNKKVWLLHQFRQVYELWGTPLADMPDDAETRGLRDMIVRADNAGLRQAKKVFTNSKIVAGRLKRFNGIDADEVLYPPLDRPELFGPGEFGDYFFYPSRQNKAKRQHVAVEAMRHVRSPFRLVLAGRPESDDYGRELQACVERWGLGDRVDFLGWVSEEEKARWMSGACAALYLPYDEDSYGYVTLEAFHSHKAVVTFTDSGGTNELIEHGHNGLAVEPSPEELARAMEELYADRRRARDLGQAAHQTLARHRIDWDCVLDRLTAA
jgi:glycosyltransferase involved in cell wall biosynthesis